MSTQTTPYDEQTPAKSEDDVQGDTPDHHEDQLTEEEKQLETYFNSWDNLSAQEKRSCYYLFCKDFFMKFFPVSMVFCIFVLTNLANLLFVAHSEYPDREDIKGGVGIGVMIYNMVGVSVCFGLASALDTLCTHAYSAKLNYLMGCYLNRARVILTLSFIPVLFILLFVEDILLLVGYDKNDNKRDLAYHAGMFCRGLLPGLWFFYQCDGMRRFLQAQGIFIPTIGVVLATSLVHPLWLYLFFNVFEWGAFGVGMASSVTNILNFGLVYFLCSYKSKKDAFFAINADSFKGWKEFMAVAIPSFLMIGLETWNYQITAIMTGTIDNEDQVNGNNQLLNIGLFFYMFPFGLAVASSTLVGKFVGKFNVKATEMSCKLSIIFSLGCSVIMMSLLAILRPWIPYIYTDKDHQVEVMKTLIAYYIPYEFFDFLTTSYAGMFRGLGMQTIISVANFVCFYLISIPLCYLLVFPAGLEIYGNWISYIIAIVCLVLSYTYVYVRKVDFYAICKESQKRMSKDSYSLHSQKVTDHTSLL